MNPVHFWSGIATMGIHVPIKWSLRWNRLTSDSTKVVYQCCCVFYFVLAFSLTNENARTKWIKHINILWCYRSCEYKCECKCKCECESECECECKCGNWFSHNTDWCKCKWKSIESTNFNIGSQISKQTLSFSLLHWHWCTAYRMLDAAFCA